MLVFAIKSETPGTMTSKHGGAMPIAGGAYGSSSTVNTVYVRSELVFVCPQDRWNTPQRAANNLMKQFQERFPKRSR